MVKADDGREHDRRQHDGQARRLLAGLLGFAGGGALGDVFRARDTRIGRTVALMAPPAMSDM